MVLATFMRHLRRAKARTSRVATSASCNVPLTSSRRYNYSYGVPPFVVLLRQFLQWYEQMGHQKNTLEMRFACFLRRNAKIQWTCGSTVFQVPVLWWEAPAWSAWMSLLLDWIPWPEDVWGILCGRK